MRRNWYIAFGIILLAIAGLFAMWHDLRWFLLILIPIVLIGLYDVTQKQHTLLRNFPVLGHIRYILEFIRPEIQQYFIADDRSERPFDRETRSVIYQRAKGIRDTVPFGTERDIRAVGYQWVQHSMVPKAVSEIEPRVQVGGPDCKKPYTASRLNISAMSYGSLSQNALMALNKGAKIGNFAHNTGEGGLSDYHLAGGGDIIFQIGTGYFGCRDEHGRFSDEEFVKEIKAHGDVVKMIELKISQGAKPSHGGILPAAKLTQEIARIRKVPMGKDVLSPPAHAEFDTPEGMMKFIQRLRDLSEGRPVGFKICIGRRSEFLSICKAMLKTGILPDFITVDGAEGGTGAAPLEFVNHIGAPLDEGLSFVHNSLVGVGLRDKIRVIASGKVATGFDMVSKLALGADMCNSARGMMMALGCIQSMQCHANTCPTGVATQDKRLAKGLDIDDKKIRVAQFHDNTVRSFLEIVGAMGLKNPSDIKPHMVYRRVAEGKVLTYEEIYGNFEPGCFLKGNIPEKWQKPWEEASAERF
ncbi:MAG: FMN-binding glutamate synthase family protein [Gammaproteobacteria bacterium]|nr:FMN-binding glutamate synthase family protein [Gammaproteobacteria bacterium]